MKKHFQIIWFTIISASFLFTSCYKPEKSAHLQGHVTMDLLSVTAFYNYSTVDWCALDTVYYRPYNCDWPEEIGSRIIPGFPPEYATQYWHLLQNAKTKFHQQTLPLRAITSDRTQQQLDRTEAAFDSIYVHIVSQEYYLRIFPDCYNELIPPMIDSLFLALSHSADL
jgi:hypothetical protein